MKGWRSFPRAKRYKERKGREGNGGCRELRPGRPRWVTGQSKLAHWCGLCLGGKELGPTSRVEGCSCTIICCFPPGPSHVRVRSRWKYWPSCEGRECDKEAFYVNRPVFVVGAPLWRFPERWVFPTAMRCDMPRHSSHGRSVMARAKASSKRGRLGLRRLLEKL